MLSQTSSKAAAFIHEVLRLNPKLAVFDCDGTLWSGDAGEGFFSWEIKRGIVGNDIGHRMQARYNDYRAGRVGETEMCGEMVTMHAGLSEESVKEASREFFEENYAARIFPEMRELISRLQSSGCDVWAVSSTNEWVIATAMQHFGIPADRVLAATVEVHDGVITDRLVRVPSGPGKPEAISQVIRRVPDAVFGNSRWDADMLEMTPRPYAINPNPDLEKKAQQMGWTIYWPDGTRP
jgi:HAD superfamily phosphoserine phosphatase-like hydrolase